MHDRASVRGVKVGKKNRKMKPTASMIAVRNRALATMTKIGIAVGLIAAIGLGSDELKKRALTSPRLMIDTIDIKGSERATKESLIRLAGISEGQNIFMIDVEESEKNLLAHPWVKRAQITRRLPRTIIVEIEEHQPRVLVALGHLYYANEAGEIVKRYTPGEREKLPIVTGLQRNEIETDDGQARARLRSAIEFLDEMKIVLGERAPPISEIHLDPALGLSFVSADDDTTVIVGSPPWKETIQRFVEVKDALAKKGVRATRIMLGGDRRPDRGVARLAANGAQAAVSLE
jgi:cell division protein FtsQ